LFYKGVMDAATIGEIAVPRSERVLAGALREPGSNLGDILFVRRPDQNSCRLVGLSFFRHLKIVKRLKEKAKTWRVEQAFMPAVKH